MLLILQVLLDLSLWEHCKYSGAIYAVHPFLHVAIHIFQNSNLFMGKVNDMGKVISVTDITQLEDMYVQISSNGTIPTYFHLSICLMQSTRFDIISSDLFCLVEQTTCTQRYCQVLQLRPKFVLKNFQGFSFRP